MMYSVTLDSSSEHLTTSPIFPCRQLIGQHSVDGSLSKSTPVTKLQETNCLSSGASPWLSKEHGLSNANAAMKTVTHTGYELHSATLPLPCVVARKLQFASVKCSDYHSYQLV